MNANRPYFAKATKGRREWLMKNCAAAQHTAKAVLAVGLCQEPLRQRFLIATTASRVFQQSLSVIISANQWFKI
jgi:hypothetical protein